MVRVKGPVWARWQLLTLKTESSGTRSPRELSLENCSQSRVSPTQEGGCGIWICVPIAGILVE